MTEDQHIVAGLDIGTTKVCAVVGRMNDYGNLEVLGVGTAPCDGVAKGAVTNIEKTAAAITKAVTLASEAAQVDIRLVNVSISGQTVRHFEHPGYLTRTNQNEEVSVDDIRRLCNEMFLTVIPMGNKIVHVYPKEYALDYESNIKDPVGMAGVRLEGQFHIVYAQMSAVDSIEKAVRRAGLEIGDIILAPVASAMACLSEEEKDAGVALVDIGGGTTDIAVFYEGLVRHTAIVPFGGNIITNDIRQGVNVLPVQAELLKTRFGVAIAEESSLNDIVSITGLKNRQPKEISVRTLSHIIEARMAEILEAVHFELISSKYEGRLGGGIVITGGGSLLAKVDNLFEFMTGKDCRIGYPTEHLAKSRFEDVKSPATATAIGLVLAGFRHMDERENRYRTLYQRREELRANTIKEDKPKVGFSLKGLLGKTRGFLVDDLDDKSTY